MTDRLISERAAIDAAKRYLMDCQIEDADWHGDGIEYELNNLPSAQPERKKGKWERTGRKNVYGGYEVKCSVCGDNMMITGIDREHYCRNCGARMEGRNDGM